MCGKQHKIIIFKAGVKKLAKKQPNESLAAAALEQTSYQMDQRKVLECRHCKKEWSPAETAKESPPFGFASCINGCDVYMCAKCTVCRKRHLLELFVGKPPKPEYRYASVQCDLCRRTPPQTEIDTNGFFRCDPCNYDVCKECITMPANMINSITAKK